MWFEYLLVFLFGGIGCVSRYAVGGLMHRLLGYGFPFGTLTVNVLGSFFLSLFIELTLTVLPLDPAIRTGIAVGFFGGFTTFSSFSYETTKLLSEGSLFLSGLNVVLNVILCIGAALVGFYVAKRLVF